MNNQKKLQLRLKQVEQKIIELKEKKGLLEKEWSEDISGEISKILLKKKAFSIERGRLLKGIESLLDQLKKSQKPQVSQESQVEIKVEGELEAKEKAESGD